MPIRHKAACAAVALAALGFCVDATPASAALLVDGNSRIEISPNSMLGVSSWEVDGVNHLDYSWLWYGGSLLAHEYSLDSVYQSQSLHDENGDGDFEKIEAVYQWGPVEITLTYVLSGGLAGSHESQLNGTMTLANTGPIAIDASLFAYFDFDLNGTGGADDVVYRRGAQAMRQYQGFTVVDVSVGTPPDGWEIAESPTIFEKLIDTQADDLANASSYAGYPEFAWQWNALIPGNSSVEVGLGEARIYSTPEPASLAVWSLLGIVGATCWWRKRKAH